LPKAKPIWRAGKELDQISLAAGIGRDYLHCLGEGSDFGNRPHPDGRTGASHSIAALRTMQQAVRDALIALMAATAQAQAEATKSAQRAVIDHKRRAQPSAYLGRKPSYDRATFDRIRLALDSASPPSLSSIATAERLSKQTVFRLKQDPQAALAALEAWGL
jgi:DNA invertase Pin-like site-specific DNA recombinase